MIPTHVFNSMILTDNPCTQLIPSNSIKPIEVTYCKNTLYNTCINQQYQIQQMLNKYQDIEQNLNGQISKDNTKMQNDINCFLHLRPHNQQIYLHHFKNDVLPWQVTVTVQLPPANLQNLQAPTCRLIRQRAVDAVPIQFHSNHRRS